jgi:SAM-dependent methyltransferase
MQRKCQNCGGIDHFLKFITKDFNRRIGNTRFMHMECKQCGVITISNPPQNLSDYYPTTYHHPHKDLNILKANASHEAYKVDIVKKFKEGGSLLEIGPSYGTFTYLASQSGFKVSAIEMDKECCNFLSTVVGIDVIQSNTPEKALYSSAKTYDVICLWHVIEHLPNPFEVLNAIYSKLNPKGIVVLAAPNPDAFQFAMMGKYWPHVDAPRHLNLLPAKTIEAHLMKLDMLPLLATTRDPGSLAWNIFGWEYLLMNLGRSNLARRFLGKLGRLIGRGLKKFDGAEGRGSAYTLAFQKK